METMMRKISVIIPVYKVEKYLRQCLDSIVNQTYKNLEIILIDDGSPDNCGKICDEYARQDPRVCVIHKENAGLSAAWNDGIREATGEWISFVDSDDWIDLNYFETILNNSHLKETEIIQTGGAYYEESERQYVRRMLSEPFYFENGEGREYLVTSTLVRSEDKQVKAKIAGVWGKLYRTSFLHNGGFQFNEKIRAGLPNDGLFNVEVFMNASTVEGIVYYGYHYRITENSGTFRFDPKRPQSQEYAFQQFEKLIDKPSVSPKIGKAFESYCLRDIAQNLTKTYLHPENKSSSKETADGIREMKNMPCYHRAIFSRNNPFNNNKLLAFQLALRLPWVWPLKVMVGLWNRLDRGEKKTNVEKAR